MTARAPGQKVNLIGVADGWEWYSFSCTQGIGASWGSGGCLIVQKGRAGPLRGAAPPGPFVPLLDTSRYVYSGVQDPMVSHIKAVDPS